MTRFQTEKQLSHIQTSLPSHFKNDFEAMYYTLSDSNACDKNQCDLDVLFASKKPLVHCENLWSVLWPITFKSNNDFYCLPLNEFIFMEATCTAMYQSCSNKVFKICKGLKNILMQEIPYNASTTNKCTYIFAQWTTEDGSIFDMSDCNLGQIVRLFQHSVEIDKHIKHVLGGVKWFVAINEDTGYINPASVWYTDRLLDVDVCVW